MRLPGLHFSVGSQWYILVMLRRQFSEHEVATVIDSGYFDPDWYREISGQANVSAIDLAAHYLAVGWLRKLDPSPDFCGNHYLMEHRDVLESMANPLLHYLASGRKEGRIWYRHLADPLSLGSSSGWPIWDPRISAEMDVLVLVTEGSESRLARTREALNRQTHVGAAVRSLGPATGDPLETKVIRLVYEHAQTSSPFPFVAILQAGDEPSDDWLENLRYQHEGREIPAVGSQVTMSSSGVSLGGFRITSRRHLRPIEANKMKLHHAGSRPVQYVDVRGSMLRPLLVSRVLESLHNPTWLEVCAESWLADRPCFATSKATLSRLNTAPGDTEMGSLRVVPAEQPDPRRFRSFMSSSGLEHGGFQRLRLIGSPSNNVPLTPLVGAALGIIETLGFEVQETDEESRSGWAPITAGDLRVTTQHDYVDSVLASEVGRRIVYLVIESHCECGTAQCRDLGVRFAKVPSLRHGILESYWNLARGVHLFCRKTSGVESPDTHHARRSIAAAFIESGFQPIGYQV